MSVVERYRLWFEHEKAASVQVFQMVASVPENKRADQRFARILVLMAHVSACRENWLDRIKTSGESQTEWWPESADLDGLPARYQRMESAWDNYLATLEDQSLDVDFDFWVSEHKGYRWNIEGQIMQLVGHGFYHRGQVVMLIDELGGKTEDTDFLFWRRQTQPDRWVNLGR